MAPAIQMTTAIAALGSRLPELDLSRETVLLRSACATLQETGDGLFSSMTVSLPLGNSSHNLSALRALTIDVTREYGLVAQLELSPTRLSVRITRTHSELDGK